MFSRYLYLLVSSLGGMTAVSAPAAQYPVHRIAYRESYVESGWKVFEDPKVVMGGYRYRILQASHLETVCEMLAPGSRRVMWDLEDGRSGWSAMVTRKRNFYETPSNTYLARIMCRE